MIDAKGFSIRELAAREHLPEQYANWYEGYRALQVVDNEGTLRGELVWRLATGQTVEITEFGIIRPEDRRQGLGTRLLEAGLVSMRRFSAARDIRFRRVYAFCDSINESGRAFYEARGFRLQSILKGFYHYCDAALYVLDVDAGAGGDASPVLGSRPTDL
jgi:ribosomal protein S18 acetylase RimI-like enzyme